MKKIDVSALILVLIPTIISIFQQDMRTMILDLFQSFNWQYLLLISFCLGILYFILRIFTLIAIKEIKQYNNQLVESIKIDQKINFVTARILRDIFIPHFIRTDKDKERFAEDLIKEGFQKEQLTEYSMPTEIIKIVETKQAEKRLENLKSA